MSAFLSSWNLAVKNLYIINGTKVKNCWAMEAKEQKSSDITSFIPMTFGWTSHEEQLVA